MPSYDKTTEAALCALGRTEEEFRALCIFNPKLRRIVALAADNLPSSASTAFWSAPNALEKSLQSNLAGHKVPPPPVRDTLCEDLAQKMNEILKAESVASYIGFYKETHARYEHTRIFSQTRTVEKNPNYFFQNDIAVFIGGSDFKAYTDSAAFVPLAERDRLRVQYTIFLEQAAVISLMDICIQIDPEEFFSSLVFSKKIMDQKNFRTAIRANRAFMDTALARNKLRLFSSKEIQGFYLAAEKTAKEEDQNKIKHVQIRRLLLLFRMQEPDVFSSRVLTAKDYLNFFEVRKDELGIEKLPTPDHFNQLLGEFFIRKNIRECAEPSPIEFMSNFSPEDLFGEKSFRGD